MSSQPIMCIYKLSEVILCSNFLYYQEYTSFNFIQSLSIATKSNSNTTT